jgi:hypothetical protein
LKTAPGGDSFKRRIKRSIEWAGIFQVPNKFQSARSKIATNREP